MRFLPVLFLLCWLSACGAAYRLPWESANVGVVTSDPDSIPNIGWQTQNQRQVLAQQGAGILQQQRQQGAEEPAAETAPSEAAAPPALAPARKISVSLLLPLSGKKADLGQSMLRAAQMALFDIGSGSLQLVPRDTKSTRDGAQTAASAAIEAHADLILGPVFAEDLKAVRPLAAAANIPVVSFTTDWTQGDSNTYIMGFLPFTQVTRVAKYAQSQGLRRVAVYAPQTEYCDVVIRTLQKSDLAVAHVNRYSPLQDDLGTLVQDFASTSKDPADAGRFDFDALMLPVGSEGLRTLLISLGANGIEQPKVRFLGTGLWDDPVLTRDPALFGGWFAAPDPALRADFDKRYQENYGAMPLRLASLAYDATALAAVLARAPVAEGQSPFTPEAMTNPRGFAGIDGIFRFRPDGLSERGLAVLEIQAGKARVIDRAPTAFLTPGT